MEKRNLLEEQIYNECLNRIQKLNSETKAQWGSMTSAQMLAHCSEIQEVINGKPLKNTPLIARLFRGIIKKMVLNTKPYPKNSKTHPQYIQKEDKEFEQEKLRLITALKLFYNTDKNKLTSTLHPLFGKMSAEEKGWAMYKHLDHHLQQFNV